MYGHEAEQRQLGFDKASSDFLYAQEDTEKRVSISESSDLQSLFKVRSGWTAQNRRVQNNQLLEKLALNPPEISQPSHKSCR